MSRAVHAPREYVGVRQLTLDFLAMVGLGAFLFGVWQVNQPAAFIAGGAIVMGGAIAAARRGRS